MDALTQIESNIRTVGRQNRTVITQAHFELFISPSQIDHLSFATPLPDDPTDWAEAIANMQAAFSQHGKRPRLEYIADLHPDLAPALEQAGLVCESRTPVMALDLAKLGPPPNPSPLANYRPLTNDKPFLTTFLRRQSVAYGGDGGDDSLGWLPHLQSGLQNGRVLGAVLLQGDEMVSGAVIQLGGEIGGSGRSNAIRSARSAACSGRVSSRRRSALPSSSAAATACKNSELT
ncbi:MAG: hypothetical protein R6X32_13655, partial [Chloroflexota bacterium]